MHTMALAASRSMLYQNLQGGATTTFAGEFICDTCVVRTLAFLLLASANGGQSARWLVCRREGSPASCSAGAGLTWGPSLRLRHVMCSGDTAHAATDEPALPHAIRALNVILVIFGI